MNIKYYSTAWLSEYEGRCNIGTGPMDIFQGFGSVNENLLSTLNCENDNVLLKMDVQFCLPITKKLQLTGSKRTNLHQSKELELSHSPQWHLE